ncbi:MAG TPA: GGDEF domain-containing protein [Deltaproteobacteria bacterium]|nr:GGDEF domain-containing protein [Deltaproteobacteria bacterium]
MKAVMRFVTPGGMVVLASILAVHNHTVETNLGLIARVYPTVVFIVSTAYGLRFNRSCLVFGSACISLSLACLAYAGSIPHPDDIYWRLAYAAGGVLLPLDLTVLGFLRERGTFTPRGLARLLAILAQPLLVGMFAARDPAGFVETLERDLLPFSFGLVSEMPQSAALTLLLCLCVILGLYMRKGQARDAGFFWALCATGAAFAAGSDRDVAAFHLAGASLALLLSIVETSHAMAFRDDLTGLPGRRALREEFLKLSGPYCIAMVDVDHFKKFNDTHGHDAGDEVLRMVAARLSRVGGSGRAFRFGGEEFTIVFSGSDINESLEHLEQVRSTIAATRFAIRSALRPRRRPEKVKRPVREPVRVRVTVSIGAACDVCGDKSPDDVLKAADKALYRAKRTGRNRVVAC